MFDNKFRILDPYCFVSYKYYIKYNLIDKLMYYRVANDIHNKYDWYSPNIKFDCEPSAQNAKETVKRLLNLQLFI